MVPLYVSSVDSRFDLHLFFPPPPLIHFLSPPFLLSKNNTTPKKKKKKKSPAEQSCPLDPKIPRPDRLDRPEINHRQPWAGTSLKNGETGTLLVNTWRTNDPRFHYHSAAATTYSNFFGTWISLERLRFTYMVVFFTGNLTRLPLVLARSVRLGEA